MSTGVLVALTYGCISIKHTDIYQSNHMLDHLITSGVYSIKHTDMHQSNHIFDHLIMSGMPNPVVMVVLMKWMHMKRTRGTKRRLMVLQGS